PRLAMPSCILLRRGLPCCRLFHSGLNLNGVQESCQNPAKLRLSTILSICRHCQTRASETSLLQYNDSVVADLLVRIEERSGVLRAFCPSELRLSSGPLLQRRCGALAHWRRAIDRQGYSDTPTRKQPHTARERKGHRRGECSDGADTKEA